MYLNNYACSELIRNMTLKYLSRTLPILKADETLPKVAQLEQQDDLLSQNTYGAVSIVLTQY